MKPLNGIQLNGKALADYPELAEAAELVRAELARAGIEAGFRAYRGRGAKRDRLTFNRYLPEDRFRICRLAAKYQGMVHKADGWWLNFVVVFVGEDSRAYLERPPFTKDYNDDAS